MTLSDDELRAHLERRANAAREADILDPARAVASTPRAARRRGRTQAFGIASAAASVVVAFALIGSTLLRDPSQASQSPGASATDDDTPAPTVASPPTAEAWRTLVWEAVAADAFASTGNTYVTDGIADGDGFLAIGRTSDGDATTSWIWRSPDGKSWSRDDGDWLRSTQLDHILRFKDGLIIIGREIVPNANGTPGATRPAVWWSEDGTTWVERTPEASEGLFFGSAAAGPSGLLISASDQRVHDYWLKSDADFNWTRVDAKWPNDVRIFGVAPGGLGWLAFGATGAGGITTMRADGTQGGIWTSSDAVAWIPDAIDEPGGVIMEVQRIGARYAALGDDRGLRCDGCLGGPFRAMRPLVTWLSSDGRMWQRGTQTEIGLLQTGSFGFSGGLTASDDSRILALESSPDGQLRIRQTIDGMTWSEVEVRQRIDRPTILGPHGLPSIGGPVIVGRTGVVAFGQTPDDPEATSTWPLPRFASAGLEPPDDSATFPPRPLPSTNDVTCPNLEPCGP
jgi:hypothetical protein